MSNTNATIVPQDREATIRRWRTEAKAWVLSTASEFIETAHRKAPRNPNLTVGQIMTYLDDLPPVPGYELIGGDNALRYQVVRSVVELAAKEGKFEIGATTNSKGRESKCFSPVGWKPTPRRRVQPTYDVELEGLVGADADRVKERISAWLDENHITATSVYAERKVG